MLDDCTCEIHRDLCYLLYVSVKGVLTRNILSQVFLGSSFVVIARTLMLRHVVSDRLHVGEFHGIHEVLVLSMPVKWKLISNDDKLPNLAVQLSTDVRLCVDTPTLHLPHPWSLLDDLCSFSSAYVSLGAPRSLLVSSLVVVSK